MNISSEPTSTATTHPRLFAIGDIHGCLHQLDTLLAHLQPTPNDHLILLGDLVDRGPDSAGVLTRIIDLAQHLRITTIMGNHEPMVPPPIDLTPMACSTRGLPRAVKSVDAHQSESPVSSIFRPHAQPLPSRSARRLPPDGNPVRLHSPSCPYPATG